jgi:hypothetical protein
MGDDPRTQGSRGRCGVVSTTVQILADQAAVHGVAIKVRDSRGLERAWLCYALEPRVAFVALGSRWEVSLRRDGRWDLHYAAGRVGDFASAKDAMENAS